MCYTVLFLSLGARLTNIILTKASFFVILVLIIIKTKRYGRLMKTAVITGCNRGLGEGIKNVLLKEGYKVIGLNRTLSEVKQGNFVEIKCDVSDYNEVKSACLRIDGVDLLVLNAGIRRFKAIAETDIKEWTDSVNTNLNGVFNVTNALVKNVLRSKGDIVIIGSHSEKYAFEKGSAYCATKCALKGFSECLGEEVRYDDVRVSYLSLGSIKNRDHGVDEEWKLLPEEVGQAIVGLIGLPKKIYIPYVDIRPLKPLKDSRDGIEKLQYV